jgi:hypothetical protein
MKTARINLGTRAFAPLEDYFRNKNIDDEDDEEL